MKKITLGLMSGTSMDGVDAVLLETDGETHNRLLTSHSVRYDSATQVQLKTLELIAHQQQGHIDNIRKALVAESKNQLHFDDIIKCSTEWHLKAAHELIQKSDLKPVDIQCVGYHGQTVYHAPSHKISLQLGDSQWLANQLGIPVIGDFRITDIQAGGQGAPLAPLYHFYRCCSDQIFPRVIVNCGGIANITVISGATLDDVTGFDCGPGNVLLDRFVRLKTNEEFNMDKDGLYAKQGKLHQNLLALLENDSCFFDGEIFYHRKPHKSLDSHQLRLIPELQALSLEDGCHTLAAFTAKMIVDSVNLLERNLKDPKWILVGGGWKNPVIYTYFKDFMQKKYPQSFIVNTGDIGWHAEFIEAELIAFLALRSERGLPLSYPQWTGVSQPTIGGKKYLPQ